MQPYTLEQTLTAVDSLNKPDQPFQYRVEDNQIIGEWKYLDATWAAPLAAGNVDKEFRVTVSFDESNHSFISKDHQSQSKSKISFNPLTGQISFGKSMGGFSGHMVGKEIGFGLGQAKQPQNQTPVGGPTYQYKFDTSEIKEPLFNFLAQTGWQKGKTSLLGKLFGRS
ncbi:MAG TPA: hypothetical protein VLF69_04535 [Candidatus Saccharimonadales bacterium]|nr:hypothetical protein [Candidatus Saccharimonadales bacterium]